MPGEIPTRLEQLRRERFLSRAQLADQTGVSKGTIRRLEERLQDDAQVATLGKLCKFFEVGPLELLGDAIYTESRAA